MKRFVYESSRGSFLHLNLPQNILNSLEKVPIYIRDHIKSLQRVLPTTPNARKKIITYTNSQRSPKVLVMFHYFETGVLFIAPNRRSMANAFAASCKLRSVTFLISTPPPPQPVWMCARFCNAISLFDYGGR